MVQCQRQTRKSRVDRPVESHRGARGNIFARPQTFSRGPSQKKNFFKVVHFGVFFEFLADGEAIQTSRGAG